MTRIISSFLLNEFVRKCFSLCFSFKSFKCRYDRCTPDAARGHCRTIDWLQICRWAETGAAATAGQLCPRPAAAVGSRAPLWGWNWRPKRRPTGRRSERQWQRRVARRASTCSTRSRWPPMLLTVTTWWAQIGTGGAGRWRGRSSWQPGRPGTSRVAGIELNCIRERTDPPVGCRNDN